MAMQLFDWVTLTNEKLYSSLCWLQQYFRLCGSQLSAHLVSAQESLKDDFSRLLHSRHAKTCQTQITRFICSSWILVFTRSLIATWLDFLIFTLWNNNSKHKLDPRGEIIAWKNLKCSINKLEETDMRLFPQRRIYYISNFALNHDSRMELGDCYVYLHAIMKCQQFGLQIFTFWSFSSLIGILLSCFTLETFGL